MQHQKTSPKEQLPLRKELVQVWWLFFAAGLPLLFLAEWAWSNFDFARIGWHRVVVYALVWPSGITFLVWDKRRRDAK